MAIDRYGQFEPCRVNTIIELELSDGFGVVASEIRTVAVVQFLEPADDEVVSWSAQ